MVRKQGPLLYVHQPLFQPVEPVMQSFAKVEAKPDAVQPLQPFREMNISEKIEYLTSRTIPVLCSIDAADTTIHGVIEKCSGDILYVKTDQPEPQPIPVPAIRHIQLADSSAAF